MSGNIQSVEVAPQPPPFSPPVPVGSDSSNYGSGILEDTTLDEPVLDTVKRDLGMVWTKLTKVMMPSRDTRDELRNWDLWGPLFLCLILAILLSIDESGNIQESTNRDRPAVVFSVMLLVVWVGAVVVTVNAKLLGGNVSFFQVLFHLSWRSHEIF
uniref:Protein YIPF n=1 Tax=Guillardia theta TaxID=55529 RepID=A0A7S4KEV4_GUITH|mmetsp:Transcript_23742/g.77292  ORF Transcript_23742/g.77292 Transcript_23742/m.77292 type:complete len:156 (+) Transcript_23742:218-685(+)